MNKRLIAFLFVVLAAVSMAAAQTTRLYGVRYSTPGTFMGDRATLVRIAERHPVGRLIMADYNETFGPGWEGCLVPKSATSIPEGALVSNNRVITTDGRIKHAATYQHRSDGKPDPAFFMENPKTGKGSWVKSCGQPFSMTPPPPGQPTVTETDFDFTANFRSDTKVQVEAEATSTSQATATGGNVQFYAPPAVYAPPVRWVASVTHDTYEVASISWQPQTKIDNKNFQTQSQQQLQQMQQMQMQIQQQQQMMQQMQQQLQELLNHLNGGDDPNVAALGEMAQSASGFAGFFAICAAVVILRS